MKSDQLLALIVATPLVLSFIIPIVRWKEKLSYPIVIAALSANVIYSVIIFITVVSQNTAIRYNMAGWPPPWGIELVVDHLTAIMLVIITVVSLNVAVFSKKSVEKELPGKIIPFYTLFLLLITGLLGIVITGDLFNIFVFLEISALTCYTLIAMGRDRALYATFRYVVMGTIGASFYLLGVGYLYMATGSLNMADLSKLLPELYQSKLVLTACIFMLVGIGLKMAIFPLHSWAPNVYTYAPSSVSALVAPLMTKVAAYMMIRVMFTVFSPKFFTEIISATVVLSWMGAAAVIVGSIYAIAQNDLKKMLSYSVVAQIGYIAIGIGLTNSYGLTGAVLHIINEAFTKACVFLTAGGIIYKLGSSDINDFKNLFRIMPFSMGAFTVGALSMIGIPPTSGFFSKLYLILGSIDAGQWIFVAVLLTSSVLNVIYFFRVIQIAAFEKPEMDYSRGKPLEKIKINEVPLSMLIPIQIMAAGILVSGIFSSEIITSVIQYIIPAGF